MELFVLIDGFDVGFTITHALSDMMKRKINLIIYSDSRCSYGLCISPAHRTERCLQSDMSLMDEAYERKDVHDSIWLSGKHNPADDLIRTERRGAALRQVIETKYFRPEAESMVTRDE